MLNKILATIKTALRREPTPRPTYGYVVRPFTPAEAEAFAEWRDHMARD